MQGCTDRFIAPWSNNRMNSLCVSATGTCSDVKTAWEDDMKKFYRI